MSIHIFGAAGGIGRWFLVNVFMPTGKVYAYDVKPLPPASGTQVTPILLEPANPPALTAALKHFAPDDWVFIAVPQAQLEGLCTILREFLPDGIGVAIMTSRQAQPFALATKILETSNVFGLHPLFGPYVTSPYGQTVALCREHPKQFDTSALEAILQKFGIRIIHRSPVEHDQDMAYVQALTHFILLSFSHFLASSGKRLEDLMEMRTPPFQFLTAFASRMLMQSPDTFAAIQSSDEHKQVRGEFLATVHELHDIFSQDDLGQSTRKIQNIKERFSVSLLEEWMHYSELAVSTLQERERTFLEKCHTRTPIVFRTRATPKYRVAIVEKVHDFSLELTEFVTRIKVDGRTFVPCPVNDLAVSAYQKEGINIKTESPLTIRKENLELLSDVHAQAWLKENVLPVQQSFTFLNPMNLKTELIVGWLPKLFPAIYECKFVSASEDLVEHASLTLLLTMDPATSVAQITGDIQAFLSGDTGSHSS